MQSVIDECNKNIESLKNGVEDYTPATVDGKPGMSKADYKKMIDELQPIKDISEIEKIKDHPACR